MSKGVDILGELNAGRSHIVVLNVEQFSKFNSKYWCRKYFSWILLLFKNFLISWSIVVALFARRKTKVLVKDSLAWRYGKLLLDSQTRRESPKVCQVWWLWLWSIHAFAIGFLRISSLTDSSDAVPHGRQHPAFNSPFHPSKQTSKSRCSGKHETSIIHGRTSFIASKTWGTGTSRSAVAKTWTHSKSTNSCWRQVVDLRRWFSSITEKSQSRKHRGGWSLGTTAWKYVCHSFQHGCRHGDRTRGSPLLPWRNENHQYISQSTLYVLLEIRLIARWKYVLICSPFSSQKVAVVPNR